jgi:hypothetical protein
MTGQMLINLAGRFSERQLNVSILEFAAPDLFRDQECETLMDRVNRICDKYMPTLTRRVHTPR